jgi:hypothetical protein
MLIYSTRPWNTASPPELQRIGFASIVTMACLCRAHCCCIEHETVARGSDWNTYQQRTKKALLSERRWNCVSCPACPLYKLRNKGLLHWKRVVVDTRNYVQIFHDKTDTEMYSYTLLYLKLVPSEHEKCVEVY